MLRNCKIQYTQENLKLTPARPQTISVSWICYKKKWITVKFFSLVNESWKRGFDFILLCCIWQSLTDHQSILIHHISDHIYAKFMLFEGGLWPERLETWETAKSLEDKKQETDHTTFSKKKRIRAHCHRIKVSLLIYIISHEWIEYRAKQYICLCTLLHDHSNKSWTYPQGPICKWTKRNSSFLISALCLSPVFRLCCAGSEQNQTW